MTPVKLSSLVLVYKLYGIIYRILYWRNKYIIIFAVKIILLNFVVPYYGLTIDKPLKTHDLSSIPDVLEDAQSWKRPIHRMKKQSSASQILIII